ncbi:MAG: class I SAM-dependent RNA methyltransferase [Rhizobiaceae bacterium]|nr:class I SAM-dependent RNA methyltransferase [Rhizobiaceae bacterium]
MNTRFTIDHLGAQGDGVAKADSGPVFIPFTLPGEVVTAARQKSRAELVALIEPSPARTEPACRHFGTCGGCALQHMNAEDYNGWKRGLVQHALRSRQLDAPVAEIVRCEPHTRRRAVFSARTTQGGVLLGYRQAASHTIVPVEECPILLPAIIERLGDFRKIVSLAEPGKNVLRLSVTATESGLDIDIGGLKKLGEKQRMALAGFAGAAGFARVSLGGEIIIEPRKPMVTFGSAAVEVPPGGFLQATLDAELVMAGLVTGHLARSRRVADLFSGSGTFALRLAASSEVHAVESDAAAVAELDRAARHTPGIRPVKVEHRDLDRRPLTAKELSRFDGIIFDPPRAGAELQAKQIAKSGVKRVAAVSCNPVTLARDLSILKECGYTLLSVTPIDQFLWSAHVEAVALLEKR